MKSKTDIKTTKRNVIEHWYEKIDIYEGVTTKTLLDSKATVLFIYSEFAKECGFKLIKLD